MSQPSSLSLPPPADPFAIGWRDVRRVAADGTVIWEQVPLTLEDALHPQEGDTILQNTDHDRDWRHLADVMTAAVADDPTALVLVDCKIEWDDPELRYHCPDVAVIFGVRDRQPRYSEFLVANEGVRPRLIIEVVSPTTRANDVATKVEHYFRAGVPFYAIVDREREGAPPTIVGYYRTTRGYARAETVDGRLWLEAVGLWLGTLDGRAACFSRDGRELGDYTAVTRQLEASERRAKLQSRRATRAEKRAAQAQSRADAERTRATQAEELAARLAERLRELGLEP